jgi:myo-inositol-1(or 4)-monophosphatase
MTRVDPQSCANLVRRIADKLAASGPRSAMNSPFANLIGHVREISAVAERTLRESLAELYPAIGWTGEEAQPVDRDYWLYDPIDGAYHYLQGLPLWSSSLVLVRAARPVLSIVYDPKFDELFVAAEGQGATCNGEPIRVSAKADPGAAVVGAAVPPLAQVGEVEQDQALALLGSMARVVFAVRPIAAASLQLAYVAAGRLDAYWETGRDAADWLAGSLLIREAGGIVTDLRGAPFGWSGEGILTGNAVIHAALSPTTRNACHAASPGNSGQRTPELFNG